MSAPHPQTVGMHNTSGDFVDLYIPRKCSATGRLINSTDHGSVIINVGQVNDQGEYTGSYDTYTLCGFIRKEGRHPLFTYRTLQADSAIDRLVSQKH